MNRFLLICFLLSCASASLHAQKRSRDRDSLEIYFDESKYLKALDYSKRQYANYKRHDNVPKMVSVAAVQSRIYFRLGDSRKATETLYDALQLAEDHDDLKSKAVVLTYMGSLLCDRLDYVTAKKRFHESLSIAKRIGNDSLQALSTQSLFAVSLRTDGDSVVYYLKKADQMYRQRKTHEAYYKAYSNSFGYYMHIGDAKLAETYSDSMLAEARRTKSKRTLFSALTNRAVVFYNKKDFKSAKVLYDELFQLQHDTLSSDIGDSYYTYAGILNGLGDYKKAYEYSEKALDLMSDRYGEDVNSAIRDVEARYAVQKGDEKRERDHQIFSIVVAVFILTIILLYFFYQNSRLKQKNKLTAMETETAQKLLSATLDAREIERKEIASVLHDNVSAMLSSAGLQLTAFSAQHGNNDEITKTRQILKETHDKVRDLSHELVPTLLAKFGLAYALEDLCEKFSTPELHFTYKDDGSIRRYDPDFETKIYFITSELLNNAIKHSKAKHALLSLKAETLLNVTLEDDGIGFDTTKPDGFGLTQIKARISRLKGKVAIASKPGLGTTIEITVPTEN